LVSVCSAAGDTHNLRRFIRIKMSKPKTKEELVKKIKDLMYRHDRRKALKKKSGYMVRIKALIKRIGEYAE
jgi:hypothetical protein